MPRERVATARQRAAAGHKLQIRLPPPMPHQVPILDSPARFKTCVAGRRFGKTCLGLIACVAGHGPDRRLRGALQGGTIWWVAPTYGVASMIWDDLKYALRGAWDDKSEMEHRIMLPGGGSVSVKSSDNPDLLRGAGLDGVVLDEAAQCEEAAWTEALRPALADRLGWAILIGTPAGQNWLWRLYEAAANRDGWARWQAPTSANPLISAAEVEEARRTLPPQVFLQEFEAQFVREGGSVFHRGWFRYFREDAARAERVLLLPDGGEQRVGVAEGAIFVTVDLAVSTKTTADYTCFGVWQQAPSGDLLLLDLWRDRIEGPDQLPALRALCDRYPVSWIAIEAVQHQLALVQEAVRAGLPARGFKPDRDKVARATLAASRYRAGTIYHREGAGWLPTLEGELLAFPNGEHDDTVDVVSSAAFQAGQSWQGLSDYYARLREKRAAAKERPEVAV